MREIRLRVARHFAAVLVTALAGLLVLGPGMLSAQSLNEGTVRLSLPASWQISPGGTALFATFATDPDGQGIAGIASVPLDGGSGARAFDAYVDAVLRIWMPEGGPAGRMVGLPPWNHAARLRGMMDWVDHGRVLSTVELRAARVGDILDIAVVAWPDGIAQEKLDAVLSVVFTARAGTGAASDTVAATTAAQAPGGPRVLFAGQPGDTWRTLGVSGDSFESFGRFANGAMRVDIPAGHAWAKIGMRSAAPLVVFDPAAPDRAQELRFEFEPGGTSAYVLAVARRDGADEWSVHDARFSWARSADGRHGTATLHIRTKVAAVVETGPEAPDVVLMRIDSGGSVRVTLPDGQSVEARLRDRPGAAGYHIHALTNAREANAPAAIALQRIVLATGLPPAVGLPVFPDLPAESVLFDGTLGGVWLRHAAHGGSFADHARLAGDGLHVRIPEGSGWSKAGLLSDGGPVWLTGLTDGAEVALDFEIEPATTSGFVLALTQSGWGGVGGNDPGKPRALFFWRRPAGAETALVDVSLNPEGPGGNLSAEAPQDAPGLVRFVLRPGEITIAAEGLAPFTRPWPMAADGAAFNIYAYAHPAEADAAAGLHLRRIRMLRQPGQPSAPPEPAPGVAPLPTETVFEGRPSEAWEPIGVAGGDFDAFARYENGRLVIDVPEGNSWGKTGLLSVEPLVRLDERVWQTPTRIELQLDPGQPQTLNMSLSTRRKADMWASHKAWLSLRYLADRNRWALALRDSPYDTWSYEIDADWMRENWDGRLWVDLGNEWGAVEIPGGPRLRTNLSIGDGHHLYAVIQAHPPGEDKAAYLGLERVSVGVIAPDGMTDAERWGLLADAEFDANAFVDSLWNAGEQK